MDVTSYLLGKKASGGGSDLSEYLNGSVSENTTKTKHIQILKKPSDIYVNDNVTSLQYAFQYSDQLILPKIHCNSNVIYIQYMFDGNQRVKNLDLSNMYATKVKNASNMFLNCTALEYIDMRNISFDENPSLGQMFGGASSNGPRSSCTIIVKSDIEKQLILSSRSDLGNIITLAELGE